MVNEALRVGELSDFLIVFSHLLMIGHYKMSSTYEERKFRSLPWLFLLLACLNAAVLGVGVLFPGSNQVKQVAEAMKHMPEQAREAPYVYAFYLIRNMKSAYDVAFVFGMISYTFSVALSDLFYRVSYLFASKTNALAPLEKAAKPEESKAKKDSNKSGKGTKKSEEKKAVVVEEEGTKMIDIEPVSYLTLGLYLICAVVGAYMTFLGYNKLPKANKPTTLVQVYRLLPRILPYRFGFLSLLETIVIMSNPRTLFHKTNKDGKRLYPTSVASALMIRLLGLIAFCLTFVLDSEWDLINKFDEFSPQKQAHVIIAFLHLFIYVQGFLPYYMRAYPTIAWMFLNVVPVLSYIIAYPSAANLKPEEVKLYIYYALVSTMGLCYVFGGVTGLGVLMILGSYVLSQSKMKQT